MKYDIFVSYRRRDRELVAAVVRKLEARGAAVWYDAEIEGGADWRETIVDALECSDMLVIFFSEACNQSRQLKKELAMADDMQKPVVPILIEDTKPKGAYLYELADRNWLQAFPDPMSHLDNMVDTLIDLAEKSEGGLEGTPQPETPAESGPIKATTNEPLQEETEALKTDAPPAPVPEPIQQRSSKASPHQASDFIGKKHKISKKTQSLNDILPFKWIDLLFLAPMIAGLIYWAQQDIDLDSEAAKYLAYTIFSLALIGLYGALVFPFRYYLRRRRVWSGLRSYIISSVILYAALMGVFMAGYSIDLFPDDDPVEIAVVFGGAWIVFAIIAFTVYGILGAQRLARNFKSNLKTV